MYELLLRIDAQPQTPYALHQHVARLMARSPDDRRDYLYAFDAQSGVLYLRASEPRPKLGAWKPYVTPKEGQAIRVFGVLYFDHSPSRQRPRGGAPTPADMKNWRNPARLSERIGSLLQRGGLQVQSVKAGVEGAVELGKPGPRVMLSPVRFVGQGMVGSAPRLADLLHQGLGRGKAFGFGCVLWRSA